MKSRIEFMVLITEVLQPTGTSCSETSIPISRSAEICPSTCGETPLVPADSVTILVINRTCIGARKNPGDFSTVPKDVFVDVFNNRNRVLDRVQRIHPLLKTSPEGFSSIGVTE